MSHSGSASAIDIAQNNVNTLDLVPYSIYLEDPKGEMTLSALIEEFDWTTPKGARMNFGHTESVYWVHLKLFNTSSENIRKVLAIAFPQLDYVDVYCGYQLCAELGDRRPISSREMITLKPAIKIDLPPHSERWFTFRVKTQGGMQIPIKLYDEELFYHGDGRQGFFATLFLAAFAFVSLMAAGFYRVYREIAFLLIALYSFSSLIYVISYYNIAYLLFFQESPNVHHYAIVTSIALAMFFGAWTAKVILSDFERSAFRKSVLNFFVGSAFVLTIVTPFLTYQLALELLFSFILMLFLFLWVFARNMLSSRGFVGKLYFFAWGAAALGGVAHASVELGFLDVPAFNHGTNVGMLLTSFTFMALLYTRVAAQSREHSMLQDKIADQRLLEMGMDRIHSLGHMIAGLLHDLRSPLASVSLALELGREEGDPKLSSAFTKAIESRRRISKILADIESFASPDSSISQEQVRLAEVMEAAYGLIKGQIDFDFRVYMHGLAVYGSKDLLQQVFINLGLNSIEAMKKQPEAVRPVITVEAAKLGNQIEVTWQDTGVGIPGDKIDSIFNAGYTTKKGGDNVSGIGLSIVRSIIRLHGGAISVDSKPGQMTQFKILLPSASGQLPELPIDQALRSYT